MYKRILKLPEPESVHLVKGNMVHKIAEDYLNGVLDELPPILKNFNKEFANLRTRGAIAEEEFCVDDEWRLIPNGWEDERTWLRAKTDARIGNIIIDFKTGKQYDSHVKQAQLYADLYLITHQDVEEVHVEFWYLESGAVSDWRFDRTDLLDRIENWNERVEKMLTDTVFAPTKHKWCKYCYVRKQCPLMSR
jgi:CRISPR/Cas system-associated exonuclease Cas4 (RecB family)